VIGGIRWLSYNIDINQSEQITVTFPYEDSDSTVAVMLHSDYQKAEIIMNNICHRFNLHIVFD